MKNGTDRYFIHYRDNSLSYWGCGLPNNGNIDRKRSTDLAQTRRFGYKDSGNPEQYTEHRAAIKKSGLLSMKTVLKWQRIRRPWIFCCAALWVVSAACFLTIRAAERNTEHVSEENHTMQEKKAINEAKHGAEKQPERQSESKSH